ncbi:MAG: hypothetical protein ACI81P_002581 [Neolewinella sp.]|jgi:hypothetical protein
MYSKERQELNERFKIVFETLKKRKAVILHDREGRGMGDFAKRVLGNRTYGHIIKAYLNDHDKRLISYEQARKICREFGVNLSYLIEGKGLPFGTDIPPLPSALHSGDAPNILYTTELAFAGASIGNEGFEDQRYISLPGIKGEGHVAFDVSGNSMEPVISSGELVVCRKLEDIRELRHNEIYVITTNGKIWIKYVQLITNKDRGITHLRLISENKLEHQPWEEEVDPAMKLFKVIRKVVKF